MLHWVYIMLLAFVQSVSFSVISRARNRNNIRYHIVASVFSNTIWFLTFRELVVNQMSWALLIPYMVGTTAGSVTGAKLSMWIERRLMAASDDHLKQ